MIKKTILMLLVLVGGVMSANAGNYKVYIKKTAPVGTLIHVWGTNITQGANQWPGVSISSLPFKEIHGVEYYYYDIVADSYQFLLQTGENENKTSDSDVLSADCYVEYNGNGGSLNILSSTVVNSLCLPGSHNDWTAENSIFTNNNDDTYSYQLAATDWVQFKLLAFSNWVNYSDVTIDAPSGWTKENDTNIALENSAAKTGYKSFDLFATDLGNGSWNLRIRGNESYDFIIGGNPAIVNGTANFSPTEELNLMTDDDKDGTFLLTVSNVQLTAGNYEYKVFRDKVTNGWQVPDANSGNKTLTITTDGTYNITYTLVVNSYALTAEAIPSGITLNPAKTYTTLTSAYNLDFTNTSLKAFIVKDDDLTDGKVTMTQVNKVPAGTGLVIKAETIGTEVTIPVFDGDADDVTGNKMEGSATEETEIAANDGYILSNGAFHPSNGQGKLAAGKAYLHIAVSTGAPALSMDFGEGTTGIQNIERIVTGNQYYTLDGRRVAEPTKGLYIVNGKKVIVK